MERQRALIMQFNPWLCTQVWSRIIEVKRIVFTIEIG